MDQWSANRGYFHGYLGSGHPRFWYIFQTNVNSEPEKMTDNTILIAGVLVFGLMIVGVILTAIEYRNLEEKSDEKLAKQKRDSNDT